jgi:anti-sigma regulatory factor (Ser/Thr protein kinase)
MHAQPPLAFPRPVMDIEVRLDPTLRAPGQARRFVARELEALGYPGLVEDARLVVSELVTNCVKNVPGKPVWVDIRRAGKYVVLEVWDCSPLAPVAQDPDFLGQGGRGLHVVEELGVKFGYDVFCCGKVVWVLLG